MVIGSSTVGAIILRISYGYKVQEKNDPLIAAADITMAQFSIIATPGAFIVDSIPICEHSLSSSC